MNLRSASLFTMFFAIAPASFGETLPERAEVFISSVAVENAPVATGRPAALAVCIENTGEKDYPAGELIVELPDGARFESDALDLPIVPAKGNATARIFFISEKPGKGKAKVRLTKNSPHVACEVPVLQHSSLPAQTLQSPPPNTQVSSAEHSSVDGKPLAETNRAMQWNFRDGTAHGWNPISGIENLRLDGQGMTFRTNSGDPAIQRVFQPFRAERYRELRLRMKTSPKAQGACQIFWAETADFSERDSLRKTILADGMFHEYVFDLSEFPRWRGNIGRIRFDPCASPEAEISIETIELR